MKEYKEFMDNIHTFNQAWVKLANTLVEIFNIVFGRILEGL